MTNFDILFNHFYNKNSATLKIVKDYFSKGILHNTHEDYKLFYTNTVEEIELKSFSLKNNMVQFNEILSNAKFNEVNHSLEIKTDYDAQDIVIEYSIFSLLTDADMYEKSKKTATLLSGYIENKPNCDGAKRALAIINSYK